MTTSGSSYMYDNGGKVCVQLFIGNQSRITWMKTIQQDLKFSNLNMDDAVDLAQTVHSGDWCLCSIVRRYALLVVLARNEWMDEWISELQVAACHMQWHNVACHPTEANMLCFNRSQAWFTCPQGMEGWVGLSVGYVPRWFTCLQIVTHSSSKHTRATQLGVKLVAFLR